jgi:hypothetical protein
MPKNQSVEGFAELWLEMLLLVYPPNPSFQILNSLLKIDYHLWLKSTRFIELVMRVFYRLFQYCFGFSTQHNYL